MYVYEIESFIAAAVAVVEWLRGRVDESRAAEVENYRRSNILLTILNHF